MAEKKSSQAVKMMHLSFPVGKVVVRSKTRPQKAVTPLNKGEELGGTKTEPRFKPKPASVFPAEKRLVKTMMFDYIVRCFHVSRRSAPSAAGNIQPDNEGGSRSCFRSVSSLKTVKLNKKKIQPYTTYHG